MTVLPGADDPEARFRVLVFSKTTGFRHDSIPSRHRGDPRSSATTHDFQVDATEDATRVPRRGALPQYDTVVFLSTTGRSAQRGAAGGVRALHQGRRRLHRHPRGGRHRVRVALVRQAGGRVLPQPPGRDAGRDGADRETRTTTRTIGAYQPRGRALDEWYNYRSPERGRAGTRTTARGRTASTCSPWSTSRPTPRTTATRRMTTIRSRGASATTAAARGTRAWATRRPRSARPRSAATSSAASRSRPAWSRTRTAARQNEPPTVRRRPRRRPAGAARRPLHGDRHGSRRRRAHVRVGVRRGGTGTGRRGPRLRDERHLHRHGDGDRRGGDTATATVTITVTTTPPPVVETALARTARRCTGSASAG